MTKAVRVVAVAIVRRPSDGAILVSEGSDAGGSSFQRPLGGTVEFGERATETVEREFLEEIGVRLRSGAMLGVLENLFTDGSMGHEVVFVLEATFVDPSMYEAEELPRLDLPASESRVRWRPRGSRLPPLVPAGIEGLL
jgi:ADP-ribose pyrophosphatase YjhB (NUDIX family)